MRAIAVALGAVAIVALMRSAVGRTVHIDESTGLPELEPDDSGLFDFPDYADFSGVPMSYDAPTNVNAFLYVIRASEHSSPDLPAYDVFYGGSRFMNFADHPVLTGEKRGIALPPEWCRKAGYADGICVSTAAGAYQINVPTWREVRDYGGPHLPDFSPESQDEAARRILRKIGALPLIEQGDLTGALALASKRWASLPGSTAGQHVRTPEFVAQAFVDGLNAQA